MMKFISKIWNKPDTHEDVFKVMPIVQGDPCSTIQIPNECCIMMSPPCTNGSRQLSGIFIRNEYIQAVHDINTFRSGRDFAPNDDIPEESDDMRSMAIWGDEMDMVVPGDDPDQGVVNTSSPVTFPTTFFNPFLDRDFQDDSKPTHAGVIITGSPGIGEHNHLGCVAYLNNFIQANLSYWNSFYTCVVLQGLPLFLLWIRTMQMCLIHLTQPDIIAPTLMLPSCHHPLGSLLTQTQQ